MIYTVICNLPEGKKLNLNFQDEIIFFCLLHPRNQMNPKTRKPEYTLLAMPATQVLFVALGVMFSHFQGLPLGEPLKLQISLPKKL